MCVRVRVCWHAHARVCVCQCVCVRVCAYVRETQRESVFVCVNSECKDLAFDDER